MITLFCQTNISEEDLEAFRLVSPNAGPFVSLTALKSGVPTETHITFEKLTLILKNLNLGYSGTGPACLEQILVELGADKEAATKAVQSQKECLSVHRWDTEQQRRNRSSITGNLGADLLTLAVEVRD